MKWLLVALSMLIKRFVHAEGTTINPIEEVKNLIKDNALKIFFAIAAAVAVGTLLASGVMLTVISLSAQIDSGVKPRLTAILVSGICIILGCLILFAIGIHKSNANNRMREKEIKAEHAASMQEALMILINDFIKERESKRTHNATYGNSRSEQNNESSEEMNELNQRPTSH